MDNQNKGESTESGELSFWYQGTFDDRLTEYFIDLSEGAAGKSRKKVALLMAESFQNIVRHSDMESEGRDLQETFGFIKGSEEIHIFSSNPVENENVPDLKKRLDYVNSLSEDDLKQHFYEMLTEGDVSDKGGAGLGLIEMARKSGKNLQYAFLPRDLYTEFNLQLDKSLSKGEAVNRASNLPIEDNITTLEKLRDDGIILYFRGDFNEEASKGISNVLMENSLSNDSMSVFSKGFFHITIEMLQNIERHGINHFGRKDGQLFVALNGNKLSAKTKNHITKEQKEKFQKELDELLGVSPDELKVLYKKRLKESVKNDDKNAKVGLIDIFRYSNGNVDVVFEEIEQTKDVVSVTLTATLEK